MGQEIKLGSDKEMMMEVYNVGSDELFVVGDTVGACFSKVYVWFVYDYNSYDYDGSGEAVALCADGRLAVFDLSHCSCYGPFEYPPITRTQEEYLTPSEEVLAPTYNKLVMAKVRELLSSKE